MAGGQERILRRRIKSVQATRKITKAMELIAASQIARSQARIAANRPYRQGMQRIIREAASADPAAARKMLATPDKVDAAIVLVVVGDRGLSGPYNSSALRAGDRLVHMLQHQGTSVRLFTVGKKAPAFFRFRGLEVEQSFTGFADRPTFADARRVASTLAAPFVAGEVQQVLLVSTRFVSAGSQVVESEQLLPLVMPSDMEVDTSVGLKGYTEFEPEVEQLLSELAPRALESEIFSALLEGAASFHTSQQRAMAAATDNADELGQTLSRIMNRARQDSITTEIMEIVGGAEALRSGK
ncbi:MAG: ATP synthase F1 subunit gamma [Actinobacteria bacterium 21-64-8]|nr:MAG: ATP synthase F1 subunit gamma [Actinobacteria bacterium 21-64-8]